MSDRRNPARTASHDSSLTIFDGLPLGHFNVANRAAILGVEQPRPRNCSEVFGHTRDDLNDHHGQILFLKKEMKRKPLIITYIHPPTCCLPNGDK